MYWLGLDVGTGGSRALLIDAAGHPCYSFVAPHEEMRMLRPLWAEQSPEDWWRAGQIAIQGVLREAGIDGSSVRGVGLTGQMHGLVLLDERRKVIRPALIWCDQRSQPQVDFINSKLGPGSVLRYTANPVLTGFTLPKLLWVRDHEPEKFAAVRTDASAERLSALQTQAAISPPTSPTRAAPRCSTLRTGSGRKEWSAVWGWSDRFYPVCTNRARSRGEYMHPPPRQQGLRPARL